MRASKSLRARLVQLSRRLSAAVQQPDQVRHGDRLGEPCGEPKPCRLYRSSKALAMTEQPLMSYRNQNQSAGDPGPVVFVLFGATGDLARRMVLPAFYRLASEGLLPGSGC
jgi:hypothetical protein